MSKKNSKYKKYSVIQNIRVNNSESDNDWEDDWENNEEFYDDRKPKVRKFRETRAT